MVSVIVPLYKGEKYVDSIINSINKNCEIIDGNNEDVELIFVNDYPEEKINVDKSAYKINVIIIEHKINCGIQQARLTGLSIARGEYVLFLDQDDLIADNYISRQLSCIGDADVAVANGYRSYEDHEVELYKRNAIGRWVGNMDMFLYGTCIIFSPGQCLIKKSSIPSIWSDMILDKNGSDDYLLWLLMLKNNCKFIYNHERLYFHNEHAKNFSSSTDSMLQAFEDVVKKIEKSTFFSIKEKNILRKRYEIKKYRNSTRMILLLLCNYKIFIYTVLYKLLGYH